MRATHARGATRSRSPSRRPDGASAHRHPFRSESTRSPSCTTRRAPAGQDLRPDCVRLRRALADHVVRPVLFMNYGGPMRWRTKAGEEVAVDLGTPLTKDVTAHAWRTALSPTGEWIPAVLQAADTRLTEARRHVPDAGGLVIATDQTQARAYARILAELAGEEPAVVLSDDAGASRRIEEFSDSLDRWMVAVRMVEGVDARLAVGVYARDVDPAVLRPGRGALQSSRRRSESRPCSCPWCRSC